jgi:hypothetical protein
MAKLDMRALHKLGRWIIVSAWALGFTQKTGLPRAKSTNNKPFTGFLKPILKTTPGGVMDGDMGTHLMAADTIGAMFRRLSATPLCRRVIGGGPCILGRSSGPIAVTLRQSA